MNRCKVKFAAAAIALTAALFFGEAHAAETMGRYFARDTLEDEHGVIAP